jgi:hypothetical protein
MFRCSRCGESTIDGGCLAVEVTYLRGILPPHYTSVRAVLCKKCQEKLSDMVYAWITGKEDISGGSPAA